MTIDDVIWAANAFKAGEIDRRDFRKIISIYLSDDDEVIPNLLSLFEANLEAKKELILDSNLELSRALIFINKKNSTKGFNKDFVMGEIKKHYIKWKDTIKCCFNIEGLP
jgi:hypothetical protein